MQLREWFPDEAACHKGMLGRHGKGYVVHDDIWTFRDFLLCLGPMLSPGLSIDRKDPEDREYAPGKIRWASARAQANNRTTTIFLEVRGERRSLSDWARLTGQKRNTLWKRHDRGCSDMEVVYGRNEHAPEPEAEPVELVEAEGYVWPGSQQAQASWEEGFRGFVAFAQHHRRLRLHGPDALTRDAFLAWVGGNILDAACFELRERWPCYGDPDWSEPQELQEHLSYRIVGIYRWPVLEARCRALSSPAQCSLLRNTLKHFGRPTAPHRQNWARVFSD